MLRSSSPFSRHCRCPAGRGSTALPWRRWRPRSATSWGWNASVRPVSCGTASAAVHSRAALQKRTLQPSLLRAAVPPTCPSAQFVSVLCRSHPHHPGATRIGRRSIQASRGYDADWCIPLVTCHAAAMKLVMPENPGATLSLAMHPFFINLSTASMLYKGDVLSGLVFLKQIKARTMAACISRPIVAPAIGLQQDTLPVSGASLQAEPCCLHAQLHRVAALSASLVR